MKKHILNLIKSALTILFPCQSLGRQSIFMSETWLEKNTKAPYVQDWL